MSLHSSYSRAGKSERACPRSVSVTRDAAPSLLLAAQEGPWSISGLSSRGNAILLDTEDLDPSLRALDPETGDLLVEIPIPGNATGNMTTYEAEGRQHVAIPIGGASQRAELIALRLPEGPS